MVCLLPAAVPEGCLRRRTMGRPAPSAFCRPAHWSGGGGQPAAAGEKVQVRRTRTVAPPATRRPMDIESLFCRPA